MLKGYNDNYETAVEVSKMGAKKTNTPLINVVMLGFLGGIFIGLGYVAYLTGIANIGTNLNAGVAKFIGALIFPVGIILVLYVGGSLFTGNNLITLAVLNKKAKFSGLVKNWIAVWIGNFLGSIFLAWIVYSSGIFSGKAIMDSTVTFATHKAELTFTHALFSGFLCNMLVALGVWASYFAKDALAKMIAVWFPVMMFVYSGFQHVVANMFVLSIGYILDPSAYTISQAFTNNLIPVTIGNALAGGVFLPCIYYFLLLKGKKEA